MLDNSFIRDVRATKLFMFQEFRHPPARAHEQQASSHLIKSLSPPAKSPGSIQDIIDSQRSGEKDASEEEIFDGGGGTPPAADDRFRDDLFKIVKSTLIEVVKGGEIAQRTGEKGGIDSREQLIKSGQKRDNEVSDRIA